MKISIFVLIFIFFVVLVKCGEMDPPIWPEYFSQSFEFETSSSNQTGRLWIDYTVNKFRFDFEHPDDRTLCEIYREYESPCTHLGANGKIYFILPEEDLCCFGEGQGLPPRDWLRTQDYIYTGEVYLDGQYFYRWQHYNWTHIEYLAGKSQKMIPRRDAKDNIIFDYWVNSYNDSPINPSVFNVPSYCDKKCSYSYSSYSYSSYSYSSYSYSSIQKKSHKFGLRKVSALIKDIIQTRQKKQSSSPKSI